MRDSRMSSPYVSRCLNKTSGFTLIELLVVLFIISIVSATVLLSISHNNSKDVQSLTNELAQTITLAQEQAMLQPAIFGLYLTDTSYQFYIYQPVKGKQAGTWVASSEDAFKQHLIPTNVQVSLKLDNAAQTKDNEKADFQPQILISTNGDLTPFTLYIGKKDAAPSYHIRGESDGYVSVKTSSEE